LAIHIVLPSPGRVENVAQDRGVQRLDHLPLVQGEGQGLAHFRLGQMRIEHVEPPVLVDRPGGGGHGEAVVAPDLLEGQLGLGEDDVGLARLQRVHLGVGVRHPVDADSGDAGRPFG
jgi:hypothetical protein